MGIIPLYMGWDKNGTFYVASELKALEGEFVQKLNYFLLVTTGLVKIMPSRWYNRDWVDYQKVKNNKTNISDF